MSDQTTSAPTCRQCGGQVSLTKNKKPRKFCSQECNNEWRRKRWEGNKLRVGLHPAHCYPKGHVPWMKGKKGVRLSPGTEFKPGHKGTRTDPVGMVRIRKQKKDSERAWVKIAEPNVWKLRAGVVWEGVNGAVPKGSIVHHKDRDTMNDAIENLELLTRAQHLEEHRRERPPFTKQFCLRGHDLSVTRRVHPSGGTSCSACVNARRHEKRLE